MNLLSTLPGKVHGIVGQNPWRIQCDGCGAIEEPNPLVNMRTVFNPVGGDRRRLCPTCQTEAGWPSY